MSPGRSTNGPVAFGGLRCRSSTPPAVPMIRAALDCLPIPEPTMAKYLNPYTDFGFKKLFGEEANKDLLIDFLDQLLPPEHQIAELAFRNAEQLPDLSPERRAIFDINCISTSGERFIVEMQKAKIHVFKDRALFYTTFPIREQAQQGP